MNERNEHITFSICIPQYNRIHFLVENLQQIALQVYPHLEICISDDCSTDNTEEVIHKIRSNYKYPILYERFQTNLGYDRNLRRAMEMATGDYIFILGNDDTLNADYAMEFLARFLVENNLPEIGFSNYISAGTRSLTTRAKVTAVIGSGPEVAIANYSCFSFIGGMIMKRTQFLQFNTATYDGSIYGQMYFSTVIIASGGRLFSIKEPIVIKDILPDHEDVRVSYLDHIPRTWKDYKPLDGGLHSVIHVVVSGFIASKTVTQNIIYRVFKKIYTTTLPYWIVNYRRNKALPAAIGLIDGLKPWKSSFYNRLSFFNKAIICFRYFFFTICGLLIPFRFFDFLAKSVLKKSTDGEKSTQDFKT